MPFLVYNASTFKGIQRNVSSTTPGSVWLCHNYDTLLDIDTDDGSNLYYGFLTKPQDKTVLGDTVTGCYSLGAYYFVPSNRLAGDKERYVQNFSDGTFRVLHPQNQTWDTVKSGLYTFCPVVYETYYDTLYYTNGRDPIQKWKTGWATSKPLKDKGATATALTGFTFTVTDGFMEITASGDVSAVLDYGDWIQLDLGLGVYGNWYEVESVSTTTINLTRSWDDGAVVAELGNKAANSTVRARYILVWNDRMYFASGDSASIPIVSEAVCCDMGISDTQYDITNPAGITARYTWDGTGTTPNLSTTFPGVGSTVDIQAQNFNAANKGTFTVTACDTNYFEISNGINVPEGNKTIGTGYIQRTDIPLP